MSPLLDAFLAQAADGGSPLGGMLVPILAMGVVFYFILIRPQQKQRKQHETFIQGLKKGDEVVTHSGLIGEVVQVEDRVVTLNVGGGTKLRLVKAQVAGQWREGAAGGAAAEKK